MDRGSTPSKPTRADLAGRKGRRRTGRPTSTTAARTSTASSRWRCPASARSASSPPCRRSSRRRAMVAGEGIATDNRSASSSRCAQLRLLPDPVHRRPVGAAGEGVPDRRLRLVSKPGVEPAGHDPVADLPGRRQRRTVIYGGKPLGARAAELRRRLDQRGLRRMAEVTPKDRSGPPGERGDGVPGGETGASSPLALRRRSAGHQRLRARPQFAHPADPALGLARLADDELVHLGVREDQEAVLGERPRGSISAARSGESTSPPPITALALPRRRRPRRAASPCRPRRGRCTTPCTPSLA